MRPVISGKKFESAIALKRTKLKHEVNHNKFVLSICSILCNPCGNVISCFCFNNLLFVSNGWMLEVYKMERNGACWCLVFAFLLIFSEHVHHNDKICFQFVVSVVYNGYFFTSFSTKYHFWIAGFFFSLITMQCKINVNLALIMIRILISFSKLKYYTH